MYHNNISIKLVSDTPNRINRSTNFFFFINPATKVSGNFPNFRKTIYKNSIPIKQPLSFDANELTTNDTMILMDAIFAVLFGRDHQLIVTVTDSPKFE